MYSPTHSFGVDSSRVLEEIMDADPRAQEVQTLLSQHLAGRSESNDSTRLVSLLANS